MLDSQQAIPVFVGQLMTDDSVCMASGYFWRSQGNQSVKMREIFRDWRFTFKIRFLRTLNPITIRFQQFVKICN